MASSPPEGAYDSTFDIAESSAIATADVSTIAPAVAPAVAPASALPSPLPALQSPPPRSLPILSPPSPQPPHLPLPQPSPFPSSATRALPLPPPACGAEFTLGAGMKGEMGQAGSRRGALNRPRGSIAAAPLRSPGRARARALAAASARVNTRRFWPRDVSSADARAPRQTGSTVRSLMRKGKKKKKRS
ncbi:hypothetical protein R5R35_011058 [Gryllus longicercus]|uniref:Uncharacterized protein n=1 Tax=Gryllus longicercus TaxID=2509291 RepID=A0AAN9Z0M7_9ORTH